MLKGLFERGKLGKAGGTTRAGRRVRLGATRVTAPTASSRGGLGGWKRPRKGQRRRGERSICKERKWRSRGGRRGDRREGRRRYKRWQRSIGRLGLQCWPIDRCLSLFLARSTVKIVLVAVGKVVKGGKPDWKSGARGRGPGIGGSSGPLEQGMVVATHGRGRDSSKAVGARCKGSRCVTRGSSKVVEWICVAVKLVI